MIDQLLKAYAIVFARPAFEGFNKLLLQASLRGLGVMNWGSDFLSGETLAAERFIIDNGLDQPGRILVDAGANDGGFTQFIVDSTKNMSVISVEPVPATYRRLEARFRGNARVTTLNTALGSEAGELTLFDHPDSDGTEHATAFPSTEVGEPNATAITVKLETLDNVLREMADRICFVKIDVEGYEFNVLRGATDLLAMKSLKGILLEFNAMNVDARVFFKDFRGLLPSFQPYRILPGGRLLRLKAYGAWKEEIFAYQNILFTRVG
jgi:FkbM family methyltransferase